MGRDLERLDVKEYEGEEAGGGNSLGLRIANKLRTWGVELRGIHPVPIEQRTDRQLSKIFFIFFSGNFDILSFSAGATGPVVFGLGLRDTCLITLFFNALCCIPPAYLTTWGPKLGMRQMCQARYSFGYYGVVVPTILNLVTGTGFMILNCILGGQTLASITDGRLSWNVGIVIVALISLLVSFCGYKLLNWYERLVWIPALISFTVAVGIGGKHLSSPAPATPATAQSVLSYVSLLAGFIVTYSPFASDYTAYLDFNAPRYRIFLYSFFGLFAPITLLMCLGAAFTVAAPSVPAWAAASERSVGDLLAAILSPAGGFGKFLTVLLSLSVTGNIAATIYSLCFNFQLLSPVFATWPRYVFSLVGTAIIIPLAIVGAHRFNATLTNFLGLIGYWASCFIAVVVLEHFVFRRHPQTHPSANDGRKGSFSNYDLTAWNRPDKLPYGVAALTASVLSFGLVLPCMDQVWFVGPIAKRTGDIGFEVAFVVTGLLYVPLRWLERRYSSR